MREISITIEANGSMSVDGMRDDFDRAGRNTADIAEEEAVKEIKDLLKTMTKKNPGLFITLVRKEETKESIREEVYDFDSDTANEEDTPWHLQGVLVDDLPW